MADFEVHIDLNGPTRLAHSAFPDPLSSRLNDVASETLDALHIGAFRWANSALL